MNPPLAGLAPRYLRETSKSLLCTNDHIMGFFPLTVSGFTIC